MAPALSATEGATLVRLARAAIAEPLCRDANLERALVQAVITPALEAPRAAFVTLKTRAPDGAETLRGCIGTMDATTPLYRNVILTAPRASGHDPRFAPLTADELDRITIEVSALAPLEPLRDVADLVLGRDGVQLDRGNHRALFLPQVGRERDWTAEQFLDNLAVKAGLASGAWRDARLSIFQVEAFREQP